MSSLRRFHHGKPEHGAAPGARLVVNRLYVWVENFIGGFLLVTFVQEGCIAASEPSLAVQE